MLKNGIRLTSVSESGVTVSRLGVLLVLPGHVRGVGKYPNTSEEGEDKQIPVNEIGGRRYYAADGIGEE